MKGKKQMDQAFKDMLTKKGISPQSLGKMEADGVTDEATLKAKINALGTVDAVSKAWTIKKSVAEALVKEYLDAPSYSPAFATAMGPLADKSGLSLAQIWKAFEGYGSSDDVLEMIRDAVLDEAAIVDIFDTGTDKGLKARVQLGVKKMLEAVVPKRPEPAPAATPISGPAPVAADVVAARRDRLIPDVPDDVSFISALETGGRAKMPATDAVAAIRAAFARRTKLFEILPLLLKEIRERSERMEESVPDLFYSLRREVRKKEHAEVLAVFEGVGELITQTEQDAFIGRINQLWEVFASFYMRLRAYREAVNEDTNNLGQVLMALRTGGRMDADMPDPMPVVGAARGVIDRLNRAFAGLGVPVARSLAVEAVRINKILQRPELPGLVGAASYDEMIKNLKVNVPADTSAQERVVAKFVLGILELPNQTPEILPDYILALERIGKSVDWTMLGQNIASTPNGTGTTSIGGKRSDPLAGRPTY